ncbi:MAG: hypothetical protein O7C75_08655 [Verrucomicrobia bacterium]|nr:hypothetical protein [Verrucomicrobiota bacterium]
MIVFHEVNNGEHWTKGWREGAESRHEMFDKIGLKALTFHNPDNPNSTGLILDITDMATFQEFMKADEVNKAMEEDGLKVDTMRMLVEFTP